MADSKTDKIMQLGQKGKVKKLLSYASSKDATERKAAAVALGSSDTDDAYNSLIFLLRDPDTSVRIGALEGLKIMGRKSAEEHVRHVLTSSTDAALSKAASETLAVVTDRNSI